MKKSLPVLLLLLFGLISCKSIKSQNDPSAETAIQVEVTMAKSFASGEAISIELANVSNKTLVLYAPTKPKIQKLEQNNWRTVRILNCPCDAPCNAPPDKIEFPVNKKISLKWDQKESYCGKRDKAGIRETISKDAGKGKYRLVTTYLTDNKTNVIYDEFIIN